MRPNRTWMLQRNDQSGMISGEFRDGVDDFIRIATRDLTIPDVTGCIPCPCTRCRNRYWETSFNVEKHLYHHGFVDGYVNWTLHGEKKWEDKSSTSVIQDFIDESKRPYVDMIIDASLGRINSEVEEDPNPSAAKFYNLLRDVDEPLWDGCKKHSKLSATTQLLNLKSEFSMSVNCYDRMISIIKSMLPESERLPENLCRSKKMVSELGLGYEKIDACPNHCMLYYKENSDKKVCSICKEPRFKMKTSTNKKDVPCSILRYFPLVPRLQRLHMSKNTSKYMRWHVDGVRQDESVMTHPSDAEAWKQFNRTHPTFSQDSRNVRLGLCTDGFNPFSNTGTPYSCWPVFVTPYNLPPSMCMKKEYIFLTLVIPGPKSPGKSLDVYLRPLVDELKMLWDIGVNTFDTWKKQNFIMKAALLWTINDFPAYGMLSGWSTHRRLACPYCMENSKSFGLKYGRKPCWFDCHHQHLPIDHPFRHDRYSFKKSVVENSLPPEHLSGIDILNRVNQLQEINFCL
ncbi:uncharacterized protein LOC114189213 [Vigna unguiculata]|uniref:uncharacterized protein LOC114189213 n=1 Tax=Vigna unguiculata TaxID=3917 RepID=UPI0010162C77|nr:uncharacterized protein LOC114189213 [Vigna unguiculata]